MVAMLSAFSAKSIAVTLSSMLNVKGTTTPAFEEAQYVAIAPKIPVIRGKKWKL